MHYDLTYIFVLCIIVRTTSEQHLLGTHFYVNHDNVLIDNTLKTVSTLARPYDLVAFIGQSERLQRIDYLQTYIDAVDDVNDLSPQQSNGIIHDKQDNINDDNSDKCDHFVNDGESLIFKILKKNLYDTFHIPFELKNVSYNDQTNAQVRTRILTCNHFCHINTSLLTFDHLPSIASRYEEQQPIRIDDEEIYNAATTINYDKQAAWAVNELFRNRSSWLAYVYLSRYFYSNQSYTNAVDCLRCALIHGTSNGDVVLVELANIVFRYGYIRDAIIFIERALDYHLQYRIANFKSLYIRSILHYYLGNLCTIDNRFVLAIQFYNRTKILLEKILKVNDGQQLDIVSSSSLGPLSILSLISISQDKIDALACHLTLELSLQRKHNLLQTKLAQLHQLRSITDELIHLNSLVKRDMSHGHSYINYFRQLKIEQKQMICGWKELRKSEYDQGHMCKYSFSWRQKYSVIMKQKDYCSIDGQFRIGKQMPPIHSVRIYCRPRNSIINVDEDVYNINTESANSKQSPMSIRLAAIERTHSSYILEDDSYYMETSGQTTSTSTTSWPTLTSRLPTEVIVETKKAFISKQVNEIYPPLKQATVIKLNEQQQPTYKDCQIHYYGLPSIGDYPTVWLPLENKGLLNIKQAFYQGIDHQNKPYPLPWSPPLCTLYKSVDETLSVIENHPVLARGSRSKAPTNLPDTNMLLNLYFYIDSTIDEQLPIEEFGQRLRVVSEKREQLLPEWIVHLLSSLYWRVNGHLPHAIDCALKAHGTIAKKQAYKQWSDLTLVNLANILYLWGKYEDALDLTQQAYSINSHEPTTNFLLGNLLALTKHNHTAAQEYYGRALAIDPTHIYARRQLRISYCHAMHIAWEEENSSNHENNDDKQSAPDESMDTNSMLSNQNDNTVSIANGRRSTDGNHSSIDRWLNRSYVSSAHKHEGLFNDARNAYRSYGLCSSSTISHSPKTDECSKGFAVTNYGTDIGHIIIVYDNLKQTFEYRILFTNDYRSIFLKEGKSTCMIYGTGRKSPRCRNTNLIDPNELNPKHNMTWWRDPSTLYEHLNELIEIINYENQLNNSTHLHSDYENFYEKYFSDEYILSKDIQEKYSLSNPINTSDADCLNSSAITYTPYISTWISPQTKNVHLNYTFFKHINKQYVDNSQPICYYPTIEQINTTNNIRILDYIITKANENLTMYRPETILKPVLMNLLFEKNPAIMYTGSDERITIGSVLAAGLRSSVYNTSWLFFHTTSLYWRLMGNASQALNCLYQSYILSPSNVQDLTYLSMALMLYNSQLHINEAIYLLYESLSVDPNSLVLTHFTLGNAMARKGHLDLAEQWYRSTLKLKQDFEPAKQRLRAIQC